MEKSFCFLMIVLFCTGCQNKADKTEFANFKTEEKIQNQNKELALEVFKSIDNNDFEKLGTLFSDDFLLNAPGIQRPWKKTDIFQGVKSFYSSFPDWQHSVIEMIAEGNKVVVKLTCRGTFKSDYKNIPSTGKTVTQDAIHIMTFNNGKVTDWWALEDNLGFQVQLGLELKPTQ